MKRLIFWIVLVVVVVGSAAASLPQIGAYMKRLATPEFATEKVVQGDLKWEVQTTGTVQPVLKVNIGSFVSGPIVELNVDFNQRVEHGELLAKVDPRLYKAAVLRDEAALATAKAEVARVKASRQQAINDHQRALQLKEINSDYISDTEMDQFRFSRESLDAQLLAAQESVKQAEASLTNSRTNLEYTDIVAPVAGIVIDRKIDPGQTLAAQFQTPELFVLAPDMDKRMWVHATVIEAEIGHVLHAQEEDRPVEFYVDAYKDELFKGRIHQVRQNPTMDQNVVTYPVIVECGNAEMKLLPGMTANLSFEIDRRENVLKIPAAAIRYLPEEKYVREEDKELLEGSTEDENVEEVSATAAGFVALQKKRRTRHVWVQDGDKLRAVEVQFGIDDGRYYELVVGELTEGQELVTRIEERR